MTDRSSSRSPPTDALAGSGWHRIYLHGSSAQTDADGRFPMTEHRAQVSEADHPLLAEGTLAEWTYPVTSALTGEVFLHLARVDEPGVVGRYELLLMHRGKSRELFVIDDSAPGDSGYTPHESCNRGRRADVAIEPGDHLLLRATNLTGGTLAVVVRGPDYFTFIDVEVE